ncbi:MAG: sulfotransferase [Reichenbachiella sp.]|uniref:sulfotransferase family protein n=1 Tax=Reichenbachiella sp. TaxID=2184521 RepID=UPI003264C23A
MTKYPNFLIIGAAKAGTTAMYNYLIQHPNIFMPKVKEPKFFCFRDLECKWTGPGDRKAYKNYITKIEDYEKLFHEVKDETAIGEATPWYLYSSYAADGIKSNIPNAKLIIILRNPVERAFSHYKHLKSLGRETSKNFIDALNAESKRKELGWGWTWLYKERGKYFEQVKYYLDRFDRDKIKIFFYEDFIEDNQSVINEVCDFVGVSPLVITMEKKNQRTIPKFPTVHSFLKRTRISRLFSYNKIEKLLVKSGFRGQVPEKLTADNRQFLYNYYKEDIIKLEALLDVKLDRWKLNDSSVEKI